MPLSDLPPSGQSTLLSQSAAGLSEQEVLSRVDFLPASLPSPWGAGRFLLPSCLNWNVDPSWVSSLLASEWELSRWLVGFSSLWTRTGTKVTTLLGLQLVDSAVDLGLARLPKHVSQSRALFLCVCTSMCVWGTLAHIMLTWPQVMDSVF